MYELSVTAPAAGAGTITSNPEGINCPGTCVASFARNTQVKLTASPGTNYFFEGWGGNCSGKNVCNLTVTGPESVSASFVSGKTLTVSMSGTGNGTVTSNPAGINCPTTCSATFPANTQVSLSETPGANDIFSSWSGACNGTSTCTVTVSSDDSVTASFVVSSSGGGSTAALVYVSSGNGNTSQVAAFSADSNGTLTPVSGSPFAFNVGGFAVMKGYLFGTDGTNVDSFAIAADGSISQVGSLNGTQYNGSGQCGGGPYALFLDTTATNLYDVDGNSCSNTAYQSFSIDAATGALTFLGISQAQSPVLSSPLSFLGNDQFAYSSNCYHFVPTIFGFTRNHDGTLTLNGMLGSNPQIPTAPSGSYYCPYLAAGGGNNVVIPLTPLNQGQIVSGPTQLAVYTADKHGNLSTTSTSANMPATAVNSSDPLGVTDIRVSPSGAYVAVSGPLGLQIFQMNGANPPTQLTGLLANVEVDQVAWDASDHLFAIASSAGKLFVFTVTAAGATPSPGSPYTIALPQSLAVLPQT